MAGAPLGNQNAARGRRWRAAIERALERKANGSAPDPNVSDLIKGLDMAADVFIGQLFDTKDVALFKELGDRLDGKAAQAIIGGDEDEPPVRISTIELRAVYPVAGSA